MISDTRVFDRIKNFILLRCDKDLVVIYLIAISVSILMFFFAPKVTIMDINDYMFAKIQLLTYCKLDYYRVPLYPLFLALTYNGTGTTIMQNIIFLISVGFCYSILKMLLSYRWVIFFFMVVYVIHPAFVFYNNVLMPESLSISLCTIYLFFLIRYIFQEKTKDCWIFHILALILIFIKPAFTFLLGISVGIFIYQSLFKRNIRRVGLFILPMILAISLVGFYSMKMKKDERVFNLSCVTDINLYWILGDHHLLDYNSIENNELKTLVQTHPYGNYAVEIMDVRKIYGWKAMHDIVQTSIQKNRKAFLIGDNITRTRLNNFKEVVGGGPIGNFWKVVTFFFSITFFQLITILCIYLLLIIYTYFKTRKIPVLSITFFVFITVNLFMFYFFAVNDLSRLAATILLVSLLVIAQLTEFSIQVIRNGKIKRDHLKIFQ